MNIQKKLSRLGIEKKDVLNYKDINYLAHYVSNILISTFPFLQDKYNEILAKILNCKMYYAKTQTGIAEVNYILDDDSIYIDEDINIFEPNEQIYREIIHYIQVQRKKNGKIKQMGLCSFGDFSIKGLGMNEVAVQYMASKMMKNEKTAINIYGIRANTISPNIYPLMTNLIEQLIYLIGENVVVNEILGQDNKFEDEFYNTFEEKANELIKEFDKMFDLKNKLLTNNSVKNNVAEKNIYEEEISQYYLSIQNVMMIKYFDNIVPRLTTIEEIDFYIEKFLNFKKYIGIEEKNKYALNDFYETYKEEIMKKFDKQLMKISKNKGKNTLSKYNNKLSVFLKKIVSQFWD